MSSLNFEIHSNSAKFIMSEERLHGVMVVSTQHRCSEKKLTPFTGLVKQ